jgi:uncharacterized protein YegL
VNDLLSTRGPLLWVIPRAELVQGPSGEMQRQLVTLLQGASAARRITDVTGRVRLNFQGYDGDPRSIFEIEECRRWILQVEHEVPWLSYALHPREALPLLVCCHVSFKVHGGSAVPDQTEQLGFLLRCAYTAYELTRLNGVSAPREKAGDFLRSTGLGDLVNDALFEALERTFEKDHGRATSSPNSPAGGQLAPASTVAAVRSPPRSDSMLEQVPFGAVEFAENPEPRCPCVLVLDTSGSMAGSPINELNQGLRHYRDELSSDDLAAKRVEVAIVTFGGTVQTVRDFSSAADFTPPVLETGGETPMGGAILDALELLRRRKEAYRQNGVLFYRPWVFLITDGAPTDEWQTAAARVREGEANNSFMFFAVGVKNARMDILRELNRERDPLMLDGLRFRDLFKWLSNSQRQISRSKTSDQVSLINPTGPKGWASAG